MLLNATLDQAWERTIMLMSCSGIPIGIQLVTVEYRMLDRPGPAVFFLYSFDSPIIQVTIILILPVENRDRGKSE